MGGLRKYLHLASRDYKENLQVPLSAYDASSPARYRSIGKDVVSRCWGGARSGVLVPSLVLVLVFSGCAPVDDSGYPPRAPGVSVTEHWQALARIEDSLERTAAMAQFVTTLGEEDLDAIEELATGMFWRHRSIDQLILMNTWARLDPPAAMKVAAYSRGTAAAAMRADVVLEWAAVDPHAVVETANLNESGVQHSLVRGWYESGLPGLSEFVLSDAASRKGQYIITSYAQELGYRGGADAIAQWIDAVRAQDGLDRMVLLQVHRKGISQMAVEDVDAALDYCDLHCDEPYAEASRLRLADRLGILGQYERALEWVEASVDADPRERGKAGQSAFGFLVRNDQDAANAWAEEMFEKYENEEWIQPIIYYAIVTRNRREPLKAAEWVPLLTDEEEREEVLIAIGRRLIKLDPVAGEQWVETSPLDDEARAEARTPLRTGSKPLKLN